MATAKQVIDIATGYLGATTGSTMHKALVDKYNSVTPRPRGYKVSYTDSWCATALTAWFDLAGASSLIYRECSCQKMIAGLTTMGIYIETDNITPQAGDIIFYDWQDSGSGDCTGWADHVGLVTEVSGASFKVIEGNSNGKVAITTRAINQKYIRGFSRPKYTQATTASTTSTTTVKYFPAYTGSSADLDVMMESVGATKYYDSTQSKKYMKRRPIAQVNGYPGTQYTGTATQNSALKKLVKSGKLLIP